MLLKRDQSKANLSSGPLAKAFNTIREEKREKPRVNNLHNRFHQVSQNMHNHTSS